MWRKIFSTMMTQASTTRPKSSAPTDNRFALSPCNTRIRMAKASAKGMVAATMIAERRLPRNSHCSAKIRRMPTTMFSMTVWMVRLIRSERS